MLRTREIRIVIVSLVDEGLERHRLRFQTGIAGIGDDAVRARQGHRRAVLDSMRDFHGQFLTVCGTLRVGCFRWVGQEAALDQHGWNSCATQNEKAATADAAIGARRASGHIIVDGRSERQTLRAVKVGFDPTRSRPRSRIEMNADEDRVPVGVRDRNASSQWDEHITVPGHHDAIARRLKNRFQTLRHVEVHHAFRNALPRNSSAIEPAVPRIDNHGR